MEMINIKYGSASLSFKLLKAGSTPINNARQVKPKENPGRPGNKFEIATNVTGMVILNKNIPAIASHGLYEPNARRGMDKNKAPAATFFHPNLSAKIPPEALPETIARVRIINKLISVFQGKTITIPTSERIAIEVKIKSRIISK